MSTAVPDDATVRVWEEGEYKVTITHHIQADYNQTTYTCPPTY